MRELWFVFNSTFVTYKRILMRVFESLQPANLVFTQPGPEAAIRKFEYQR